MSDWLDGWARRAARPAHPTPGDTAPEHGLSRRQLLKRAGVVAGAAWTVPLIQSALAPPAAASGGGNTIIGFACTTTTDCASGYCSGGFCATKLWTGDVQHEQRVLQQRVGRRRLPEGLRRSRVHQQSGLRVLARRLHGECRAASVRWHGFDLRGLCAPRVRQQQLPPSGIAPDVATRHPVPGSTARHRLPSVTTGSRLSGFEGRAWTAGWTVGPRRPRPRVRDVRPVTPRDHLG